MEMAAIFLWGAVSDFITKSSLTGRALSFIATFLLRRLLACLLVQFLAPGFTAQHVSSIVSCRQPLGLSGSPALVEVGQCSGRGGQFK